MSRFLSIFSKIVLVESKADPQAAFGQQVKGGINISRHESYLKVPVKEGGVGPCKT